MKKSVLLAIFAGLIALPIFAGHANPWATEDDELLMKNHEENLAKSEDTPGEDEMLGRMVQNARGKLDASIADSGHGSGGGGGGHGIGSH